MFDRLSILRLKSERIGNLASREHVRQEMAAIEAVAGDMSRYPTQLAPLLAELAEVNEALWDIEDDIRACERAGRFDARFVALARDVYRQNDRRADIKRRISLLLGSALVEQKAYGAHCKPV